MPLHFRNAAIVVVGNGHDPLRHGVDSALVTGQFVLMGGPPQPNGMVYHRVDEDARGVADGSRPLGLT
jgi:hypothetical protein